VNLIEKLKANLAFVPTLLFIVKSKVKYGWFGGKYRKVVIDNGLDTNVDSDTASPKRGTGNGDNGLFG
jgi:hypothetical protein